MLVSPDGLLWLLWTPRATHVHKRMMLFFSNVKLSVCLYTDTGETGVGEESISADFPQKEEGVSLSH